MKYFFVSGGILETPTTTKVIAIVLGYPPEFDKCYLPRAQDTTAFGNSTGRNQVGADQDGFPMLPSFHSVSRFYKGFWGGESLTVLPSHEPNNNWHSKMSQGMQ